MYRQPDLLLFKIISTLAFFLAIGAAISVALYIFQEDIVYRNSALGLIVLSGLLQAQLYMHKTEIMEKRVSALMDASNRLDKFTLEIGIVALYFYTGIFWVSIILLFYGCFLRS